jgi:hypothetical protein
VSDSLAWAKLGSQESCLQARWRGARLQEMRKGDCGRLGTAPARAQR